MRVCSMFFKTCAKVFPFSVRVVARLEKRTDVNARRGNGKARFQNAQQGCAFSVAPNSAAKQANLLTVIGASLTIWLHSHWRIF